MSARCIRVFGRPSSSNTQKVLWALREAGVPFQLTLASARLGPGSSHLATDPALAFGVVDTPEYLAMNPHGTIPTLVDREDCIWESHTIVRYVAATYKPELLGSSAKASSWMDWVSHGSDFSPCFTTADHHLVDQVARTAPEQRSRDAIDAAHDMYQHLFAKVETQLAATPGVFMLGKDLTVADIPIGCQLNRWSLALHRLEQDGTELDMPRLPRLAEFYQTLIAREAFDSAVYLPEAEHEQVASDARVLYGQR
jgi:glutathione S-transferase|tara:strand:+ start:2535 stop:3296 length:762 start_codon:yes stop_codon:yes gene_type:complete